MTGPTVLTLIVCCLLFVTTSSRSIDKVHLSMSEHELKYHFGVTSHADVPEYYVTSPKELKSDITKRSIGIQTFDVQFSVDIFGDSLQLQLMKNIDLLVPNFVVQRIGANYTSTYSFPRDHCCYHGDVKNNEASNVAVCTCDGLNGIIKHNGDDFMIQPLHEHDGQRMRRSAGNVHIVTKRSVDENTNVCGTRDVARSSLQDNVIRNLQVRQDIDSPKHMETLVVTEKSMHEYHGDALEQYILTLMNVVAGRFKDGSLGADFTVHLARLMILETSQTDLVVTTDSTATLSSFCSWQRGVNVDDDTDPLHHDEALLITRHDLHSEGNSGVIGKAYIGGTCNPGLQCAINEDTGFGTALTITHEVGHNLGINHDNYGNSCPNGVNIMATSSVQGSGAFEWSTCSAQQLDDFLNTVGSSCLDDNPSANDVIDIDSDFYPGEIYSADQQCKLAYGGESVACTFKVDVCEALWCQASATSGGCSTQYTPKMDGTECGTGMWCMRATCVEYGDEGPDAIDGGFSAWDTTWSECSRTCGGGVAIKKRYCTNPEPMFGGAPCSGPDAQYQLCNTEDCSASQADFIAQQCAQFDSQPFNGALYTWVPYYNVGEDDLCRLPCYAESGNFYVYYNQMVDGSRCSFGVNQKVCIDQSCESFGCDNVHNSEAILDRCGVCDGDGDTCEIVSGSYSEGTTQQYSTVVTIPVGATSVTVTESNYWCHLAVKVDGNYVISGDGNRASTGQYSHNGNTMELQSTGQLETLTVGGPLIFELELLVYRQYSSTQYSGVDPDLYYEYYIPTSGQVTSTPVTFSWSIVQGSCSTTCGTGTKQNVVVCLRDDDDTQVDVLYCDGNTRPTDPQPVTCNLQDCTPYWLIGAWGDCDVACGGGSRQRQVACVVETEPLVQEVVDDSNCEDDKPSTEEDCNTESCPPNWSAGQWSECPVTCGIGQITRTVVCVAANDPSQTVSDDECDITSKPTTSSSCERGECPAPVCDATLTEDAGILSSPNYPELYPASTDCTIQITVSQGSTIRITFTDFNVEDSSDCGYDYVKISETVDGTTSTNTYCGNQNEFFWESTGNSVTVIFHSDGSQGMTGFHAEYEVISEEPSEAPGCTGEKLILTDARGEVTSPHHPNNYPDSQDCEYEIRVEAGKRIYLIFRTLELEDSTDCAKDYLEIFDPFNDKSRKLCGSVSDMKYKTSGSRVILRFHTDSSGSASGYKLVYRTINKKIRGCHGIVNTSPATLSADNYPNRYRNRKNCLQEINAPAGQVIKISFEYIRIQNSNNCWKDYLKVKDFQDDGSVAEVTYCGDYEAFEWVSTTNLVVLKFHSNGSVRDDGYVANIQFANQ